MVGNTSGRALVITDLRSIAWTLPRPNSRGLSAVLLLHPADPSWASAIVEVAGRLGLVNGTMADGPDVDPAVATVTMEDWRAALVLPGQPDLPVVVDHVWAEFAAEEGRVVLALAPHYPPVGPDARALAHYLSEPGRAWYGNVVVRGYLPDADLGVPDVDLEVR